MRINKISIENFRSFKEKQTIELSPVTLLFGPNSTGKSSILMALFYIEQILSKKQCNPVYIDALGKKYVGGFKNLVYKRNHDETIKISICCSCDSPNELNSYTYLYPLIEKELNIKLECPLLHVFEVETSFEIAWSETKNDAYVQTYSVAFDDQEIIKTSCHENEAPTISFINYVHDLIFPKNHKEWVQEIEEQSVQNVHPYIHEVIHGYDGIYNDHTNPIPEHIDKKILLDIASLSPDERENIKLELSKDELEELFHGNIPDEILDELSKSSAEPPVYDISKNLVVNISKPSEDNPVSALHELIMKQGEKCDFIEIHNEKTFKYRHNFIEIDSDDALPILGRKLSGSLDLGDPKTTEIILELLSDLLVAPLDNLLKILKSSISIGPVRTIIDAQYQSLPYIEQGDWFDGSAAWSYLENANLDILKEVDQWMQDTDKLNLGYGLAMKTTTIQETIFDIQSAQVRYNSEGNNDIYLPENAEKMTYNERKDARYMMIDLENQISVTPSDIGSGVSQIMPLIVAAITQHNGLIACEQPELHLHPRVQVAIADLLTQHTDNANYLIETHSEHLILRLLKRIRQNADNELPIGMRVLKTEDISIIYLNPSNEGVVVKKIGINNDGEFTERWPQGFFAERREELM